MKEYSVSVTPFSLNLLPPLQLRFPGFFYRCIERNLLSCTRNATSTQRIQRKKLKRVRVEEGGRGHGEHEERTRCSAGPPFAPVFSSAGRQLRYQTVDNQARARRSATPRSSFGHCQTSALAPVPENINLGTLKTGTHQPRDQTAVNLITRPSSDSVPDLHEP